MEIVKFRKGRLFPRKGIDIMRPIPNALLLRQHFQDNVTLLQMSNVWFTVCGGLVLLLFYMLLTTADVPKRVDIPNCKRHLSPTREVVLCTMLSIARPCELVCCVKGTWEGRSAACGWSWVYFGHFSVSSPS